MSANNTELGFSKPNIICDESGGQPYRIAVNELMVAELYRYAGFKGPEINDQTLVFARGECSEPNVAGHYTMGSRQSIVHPEVAYSRCADLLNNYQAICEGRAPSNRIMVKAGPMTFRFEENNHRSLSNEQIEEQEILLGREILRLNPTIDPDELTIIITMRQSERMRGVGLDTMNYLFRETIAHEIKHAANDRCPFLRHSKMVLNRLELFAKGVFPYASGGLAHWGMGLMGGNSGIDFLPTIGAAMLAHRFSRRDFGWIKGDPDEYLANNFGKRIAADPSWQGLASIMPTDTSLAM